MAATPSRNLPTLATLAQQQNEEMQNAIASATPGFSLDDILDDEQQSLLYDSLSRHGLIATATNFTEDEVQQLYQ